MGAAAQRYALTPRSKNLDVEPNGPINDMILYELETPVPANVAVPRPVALHRPTAIEDEMMCVKGYGPRTVREWADAWKFVSFNGEEFNTHVEGTPEGGDSGGPLFLYDCDGPLFGVTRGVNATSVFSRATFARRPSTITPDIAPWLRARGVIEWMALEQGMEVTLRSQATGLYVTSAPVIDESLELVLMAAEPVSSTDHSSGPPCVRALPRSLVPRRTEA